MKLGVKNAQGYIGGNGIGSDFDQNTFSTYMKFSNDKYKRRNSA